MKIGINPGHTWTGAGSGAVGLFSEGKWNRIISNLIINELILRQQEAINIICHSAKTQNEYLKKVVDEANTEKCDIFASIHFNAGGGNGCEVYTFNGQGDRKTDYFLTEMEALGFKNRGVKNGNGLYVINNTSMPAYLFEVCFCDSQKDADLLRVYKDDISEIIADCLLK